MSAPAPPAPGHAPTLPLAWPGRAPAELGASGRGWERRRCADVAAVRSALAERGVLTDTGRVMHPDGFSWTPGDAVAAGVDPRTFPFLTPHAARMAGRVVLEGRCAARDLTWAARHWWAWLGPRAASEQTPERSLGDALDTLVFLRTLSDPGGYDGWRTYDPAVPTVARQAVRELGAGAVPWLREWTAGRGLRAQGFRQWLHGHARPWHRAMPPGVSPNDWVPRARLYAAAGLGPAEARRVARLPEEDPRRPDVRSLEVLAALRRW
jgi:hypothetical protein